MCQCLNLWVKECSNYPVWNYSLLSAENCRTRNVYLTFYDFTSVEDQALIWFTLSNMVHHSVRLLLEDNDLVYFTMRLNSNNFPRAIKWQVGKNITLSSLGKTIRIHRINLASAQCCIFWLPREKTLCFYIQYVEYGHQEMCSPCLCFYYCLMLCKIWLWVVRCIKYLMESLANPATNI